MNRNLVLGILAGILGTLGAGNAFGQYYDDGSVFPGLGGIPGGVERELQFSAQVDQQARQFCQNWYEQRQAWRRQNNYWGYLPGPVTAADLNRSNRELQATYDRHNAGWHQQQVGLYGGAGQSGSVGQFSEQGIRGYAPHYNPATGQVIGLPYGPNGYRQNYHGQFYGMDDASDDGSGMTYYPQFGR